MARKKIRKKSIVRHNPKLPNYGFGKHARYALRNVLNYVYRDGHFLTCEAHFSRFSQFIYWFRDMGVKDIRDIDINHVDKYAHYVAERVRNEYISTAYAHNLISTVNVVMFYFRRDNDLRLNALDYISARKYVRIKKPSLNDNAIDEAIEVLIKSGEKRSAALILLIRNFGLRLREGVLADLVRWKSEADKNFEIVVLDGCKGGRKCQDRKIPLNEKSKHALEFAISIKPEGSKNLLCINETYKHFINTTVKKIRAILKDHGIVNLREIRAYFLMEYFESVTGMPAPVFDKSTLDYEEELCRGYEAVACVAGHYRKNSARPYVG